MCSTFDQKMSVELLLELEADILCRLPVKILLQMRCICKRWRTMIDSQSFIKDHLNRSIQSKKNQFLILSKKCSDDLKSVDLDFLEAAVVLHHPLHHQPFRIPRQGGLFQSRFHDLPEHFQIMIPNWSPFLSQQGMILVWGTCNGMVLMSTRAASCLWNPYSCLWNPSTRKHVSLPKLEVSPLPLVRTVNLYGFGYDSSSDDYKVIKILQFETRYPKSDIQYQVWVYRLQSNYWRKVDKGFPPNMKCERQPGVLVCEALHWPVKVKSELGHGEDDFILAFDLKTEEYRMFSQPKCQNPKFYSRVGTLNGSLCLIYSYLPVGFEIWVMGDYGVDESWTIRTLQLEDFISYPGGFTKTTLNATLYNDKGPLVSWDPAPFLSDIGLYAKTSRHFGIRITDHADVCTESLASLERGAAIRQQNEGGNQ